MAVTSPAASRSWSDNWSDVGAVVLILLIVATLYGARLTHLPIVGEESRWASGAREMLSTGDWIVPRQQGVVFPERPPMTMWLMAVVGTFRGDVDTIAVRLPSVVAVVLTSLLVYGYTRVQVSGFAALVAALAYASMGQVLQIGRMGESEAVFALFVSASLLLWHLGYTRGWPSLAVWSIGFACAALGALVKGPQAPVYFVGITTVYLFVRRDWRYMLRWQYAAGATVFAAIIAAWQIPFYLATDLPTVAAIWSGLAKDRFQLAGLVEQIFTYPLETFVCLLPWSPILVALARRETRELLTDKQPLVLFLLVALAVAYPTVWLVTGARARYFMPLYPLVAVLVGLVIERCSHSAPGRYPRRAWHQFLLVWGTTITVSGAAIGIISLMVAEFGGELRPQQTLGLAFAALAVAAVAALWRGYRSTQPLAPALAVAAIAVVAGFAQVSVLMNINLAKWNDPSAAVAEVKEIVASTPLVSLTPIDHRFAYYYKAPIAELPWPSTVDDLPPNVEYFCFMRNPADTAKAREAGRGRTWTTTPGTLPFAWDEVATLCAERRIYDHPQIMVVLGRVVQPRQAMITDATKPRSTAINLSTANLSTATSTQHVSR